MYKRELPTSDELLECITGLVWQFGHRTVVNGQPAISSGCLSDMERAFQVIGWDDPHYLTETEQDGVVCEVKGCVQPSSCGQHWAEGDDLYLRICSNHAASSRRGEPRPTIKQRALDREALRDPITHTLPASYYAADIPNPEATAASSQVSQLSEKEDLGNAKEDEIR